MSLEMRKAPLEEEPEPLLALDIGRPALAVASEIGTTSEKNDYKGILRRTGPRSALNRIH